MSRKDMKEQAQQIPHIPAELGPALKMVGSVLQDEWMSRNGVFLDKDARKGHAPIADVADTDLEVRLKGKVIRFSPAKPGKPVVSIPVGMSDKVSTATIPRDWESGQLAAALVEAFSGDPYVLNLLTDRMCEAIDNASEINPETGRLKINQEKLPPVRHAVAVAEALAKLKRSFKTQSAGSPAINLSFEIEDIEEPQPIVVEAEPLASIADRVSAIAQPITIRSGPAPAPVSVSEIHSNIDVDALIQEHYESKQADWDAMSEEVDSTCEECGGEIESIYYSQGRVVDYNPKNGWCAQELPGCRPISHEMREALTETLEQVGVLENKQGEVEIQFVTPWFASGFVIEVLSDNFGSWLTMGQIKKKMKPVGWSVSDLKPKQWSAIMATLVEEGRIAKQGERRGTRYTITGDNAYESDSQLQEESFPVPMEAMIDEAPETTRESVEEEWEHIVADAEPWTTDGDREVFMVDFIDDGPRREAPHLDVCCACPNESQFEQMTAIGKRHFCSEKCYAEYTGLPVYEEGYYGLGQPKIPAPAPTPAPTSMAEALAVVEGSYSVSAVMSGSQPNNPKKEE